MHFTPDDAVSRPNLGGGFTPSAKADSLGPDPLPIQIGVRGAACTLRMAPSEDGLGIERSR
jgi:hypothetical protein